MSVNVDKALYLLAVLSGMDRLAFSQTLFAARVMLCVLAWHVGFAGKDLEMHSRRR